MKETKAEVLVIGAGIGGIESALELAESGVKVYLCDRQSYMGGTLVQLDKWFPDNHCGMCKVLPVFTREQLSQYCLRQGMSHPNIEFLPLTEVEKVEGEAGNFLVTLRIKSCGVKQELCTCCGLCEQVCPVEVDSEFNQGLEKCKAIYLRNPQALPKTYVIDYESCTRCRACVECCSTKAIDLSFPIKLKQIEVGAIILATGFKEFNPLPTTQYGYRRYPNVITGVQLERLLSGTGPSQGELRRPSDGHIPKSVAFLLCVGSRTLERDYCSSVCCMSALKEAMMVREKHPETEIHIFFMDVRTFGKGWYRYYEKVQGEPGIKFIRARIPQVRQDFHTKNLLLPVNTEDGGIETLEFELVVLSVGQTPSPQFDEVSKALGLELNKWGFCKTKEFSPVETMRKGICVCGSASGPKDIVDTVIEAAAAAGQASSLLVPVKPSVPELKPISEEPRVAIFVCNCEGEIAKVINIGEVVEFSRHLPNVVMVEEVNHLCQRDFLEKAKDKVIQGGANRFILAACATLLSTEVLKEEPLEVVNFLEELAWVHQDGGKPATEKGKSLIAMALEKLRLGESFAAPSPQPVTQRALVVGGGLAGLTAALSIAERGFEVDLVEKTAELGGNLGHIYSLLEGSNPQALLQDLVKEVEANSLIHLRRNTEVCEVAGYAGNFQVTLTDKALGSHPLQVGTIIIATGGEEFRPAEYLYGQTEQVLTQRELEARLASGQLKPKDLGSVAMIQCVGSREEERPYCCRIGCSQALKNALSLKRQNPELELIIFYRDMMSYGFVEEYYTKAREEGIMFVRYELNQKPEVKLEEGKLKVRSREPMLGGEFLLEPDLLVLSPAIIPDNNAGLAELLGVELTEDGFFQEVEMKFRPVDLTREGIYVCGLAHSPRSVSETIVQAQAAAQRTVSLLWREKLIPSRSVSEVDERWCRGCELCIEVCPYDARYRDPEKGIVRVREAFCQGCGACVAACPSGAARLRGFGDKQVLSMLDVAI